jgi:hypothetical protein
VLLLSRGTKAWARPSVVVKLASSSFILGVAKSKISTVVILRLRLDM